MKDKIVTLDRTIKVMEADNLKKALGNLKGAELIRSIIMNKKQYCTYNHPRSQRNYW